MRSTRGGSVPPLTGPATPAKTIDGIRSPTKCDLERPGSGEHRHAETPVHQLGPETVGTDRGWCDRAEGLHVLASVVVESVDGAARKLTIGGRQDRLSSWPPDSTVAQFWAAVVASAVHFLGVELKAVSAGRVSPDLVAT